MAQFIALAVSVFLVFSVANAARYTDVSRHVQIYMPPPSANDPAGVSGGGPVGSVPAPISIPPPKTSQRS
jgi:hypothetical protein